MAPASEPLGADIVLPMLAPLPSPNFSPNQSQPRETDIYMTCHTNGGVAGGEQYHSVDRRPLFARYTLALSKHPAYSTAPINKLQILILIDGAIRHETRDKSPGSSACGRGCHDY